MFVIFLLGETNIVHLEQPFICSQRLGSMVVVYLVQRLLEELKQSNPLSVTGIFSGLIGKVIRPFHCV